MTSRSLEAVVAEFLRNVLASDALGVPKLEARARAAGLLGEGQRSTHGTSPPGMESREAGHVVAGCNMRKRKLGALEVSELRGRLGRGRSSQHATESVTSPLQLRPILRRRRQPTGTHSCKGYARSDTPRDRTYRNPSALK
jgi:hypothetical protein